jgi:hypothetical protein
MCDSTHTHGLRSFITGTSVMGRLRVASIWTNGMARAASLPGETS